MMNFPYIMRLMENATACPMENTAKGAASQGRRRKEPAAEMSFAICPKASDTAASKECIVHHGKKGGRNGRVPLHHVNRFAPRKDKALPDRANPIRQGLRASHWSEKGCDA
jgi:hypothetical protein